MSDFKWRHFQEEVNSWAVRWYCRYGISYRDLEQMLGERGVPPITPRSIDGSRDTRRRLKAAALALTPATLGPFDQNLLTVLGHIDRYQHGIRRSRRYLVMVCHAPECCFDNFTLGHVDKVASQIS